jgi:hypothetical protein
MRQLQWSLWSCAPPFRLEAVLLQSLLGPLLSDVTREALRSSRWLDFFGRQRKIKLGQGSIGDLLFAQRDVGRRLDIYPAGVARLVYALDVTEQLAPPPDSTASGSSSVTSAREQVAVILARTSSRATGSFSASCQMDRQRKARVKFTLQGLGKLNSNYLYLQI